MTINNKYDLGEIVFIKTDVDQLPAQVTRVVIHDNHPTSFSYGLTHKGCYVTAEEYELNRVRDVVFATGGPISISNNDSK